MPERLSKQELDAKFYPRIYIDHKQRIFCAIHQSLQVEHYYEEITGDEKFILRITKMLQSNGYTRCCRRSFETLITES